MKKTVKQKTEISGLIVLTLTNEEIDEVLACLNQALLDSFCDDDENHPIILVIEKIEQLKETAK